MSIVAVRMVLTLRLQAASSLKEKRLVVKSVKARLRQRFNVAVAETGALDQWRTAELALVTVGSDVRVVDAEVEAITRFLDADVRFEVIERELERI